MATETLRLSTGARLSAIFAALLVGAFLMAGTITFFATARTVENAIRERIALEMQAMEFEIGAEGFAGLVEAIRSRANQPGALGYRLESHDGSIEIDNLRRSRPQPGWTRVEAGADGEQHGAQTLLVLSRLLPDGSLLSIAGNLQQAEAVRRAVLLALGWSGALALLIGLGAAAFVTRRALARMAAVADAVRRFAAGDHAVRAPHAGTRAADDIDAIADGVNSMLDSVATLAASVRRVSVAVAHDLRTPLSHMRQQLETVGDPDASGAEREAAVSGAQTAIDDVMRTFDAILSLSEIESGTAPNSFETLDLALLAATIANAYSADIEAGGRRLFSCTATPLRVQGNRYLLARAIANLLENAARHTPTGTDIGIEVFAHGATVCLSVADNGPGIPESERERALEPFYRLDRSRGSTGSGLGLAIVAAIARQHRATLVLDDAHPGLRVMLGFGARPSVTS